MLEKKKKFSIKTKHPLILASSSIIRKSILKNAGLEFTREVNDLDLKIVTNYDFLSVTPNYNANISISNSF